MGIAFEGEESFGLCSAMQTFSMRTLFCGKCQEDHESKWCYRCNSTFPPPHVLRAMAFIQPVASRSVGVIQYSYSSALSTYNASSHTYAPMDRTSQIMQHRLQELHAVGLYLHDFVENEFLWEEWNSLKTNCTTVGSAPSVFAASFAFPRRNLETIIVVNAVAKSQTVTATLQNGSRLCVSLQPWQVWVSRSGHSNVTTYP